MAVSIKFTYVPLYPDEAPIIEIAESESISDDDINALLEFLQSRVRMIHYYLFVKPIYNMH